MSKAPTGRARGAAAEEVHVQTAEVEAGAHVEQRSLQIERLFTAAGISIHHDFHVAQEVRLESRTARRLPRTPSGPLVQ